MGSRHGTPKAPVERPKVPPGAAARRTLIKDTTGTVRCRHGNRLAELLSGTHAISILIGSDLELRSSS